MYISYNVIIIIKGAMNAEGRLWGGKNQQLSVQATQKAKRTIPL